MSPRQITLHSFTNLAFMLPLQRTSVSSLPVMPDSKWMLPSASKLELVTLPLTWMCLPAFMV